MKIVNLDELKAIKTPVVFACIDVDEENVGELYYKVADQEGTDMGRALKVVSLGTSTAERTGIENYYEMLESFEDGQATELTWAENVDNSDLVVSLLFTDEPTFLLYSKQDIQNMAAAFAGIWKSLPA